MVMEYGSALGLMSPARLDNARIAGMAISRF
jgi:hypothetical protein